jgi:hypothetical protein
VVEGIRRKSRRNNEMSETRLSDIVQALDQQEFGVKLAALEAAYEGDDLRQQLLDEAVDLLKQAEAEGEVAPMSDSGMLSAAAQLVEDHIAAHTEPEDEGSEKVAGAEGEGEEEELSKEAAEELAELGSLAGEALQVAGISEEDLEKVASEEESEQLGRLAANILLELDAEEGAEEE